MPAPSAPAVDEGEGSHDSHTADSLASLADIREPESHSPESRALDEHPPATMQPFVPPARPFVRQDRRPGPGAGLGANPGPACPVSRASRLASVLVSSPAAIAPVRDNLKAIARGRAVIVADDAVADASGVAGAASTGLGRDLPPSKYASPRPFSPSSLPYEPPPDEPSADYTRSSCPVSRSRNTKIAFQERQRPQLIGSAI